MPVNRDSQDPRDGLTYVLVHTEGVRAARNWPMIPTLAGSSPIQKAEGETRDMQGSLGLTGKWQLRQDTTLKGA